MLAGANIKETRYMIAAIAATIVCAAVIVLIPVLGQWLGIPFNNDTPTITADSTPTHLPPASRATPLPIVAELKDEWIRPADGMTMLYVPPPAGPFELGSGIMAPLEAYWIDKHPITNAQYQLCVADGLCKPSARINDTNYNGDNQPVVSISWFDALDYVGWLNRTMPADTDWHYALPDEAMWEYAAVGETGWEYPWGDEFDGTLLNFCDINCRGRWKVDNWNDGYRYTSPVGSYPAGASWVGALDLAGNVWEWTDSWWDEEETRRIVRGGSWYFPQSSARAFSYDLFRPETRTTSVGFRVVVVGRSPSHPDH